MKHKVAQAYINEIKAALKKFGEYSYYDKGASEVMLIDAKPFLSLPQIERVIVAKELMAYKHGEPFCMELAGDIDRAPKAKLSSTFGQLARRHLKFSLRAHRPMQSLYTAMSSATKRLLFIRHR